MLAMHGSVHQPKLHGLAVRERVQVRWRAASSSFSTGADLLIIRRIAPFGLLQHAGVEVIGAAGGEAHQDAA